MTDKEFLAIIEALQQRQSLLEERIKKLEAQLDKPRERPNGSSRIITNDTYEESAKRLVQLRAMAAELKKRPPL